MILRSIPIVFLVVLLVVPFVFRIPEPEVPADARVLVVVSPHNEQIRSEFSRAFEAWCKTRFDEYVKVAWSTPGGTSEIRKLLISEYTSALENGLPPGGNADLLWGGGSYEFSLLSQPITVTTPNGETRETRVLAPMEFADEDLREVYGDGEIAGQPLFDAERRWFGTALSSFGIVFNRDVLPEIDVPSPTSWEDLTVPEYQSWITMVDPGMSGSVTTAFEAILQHRGWNEGWWILRRLAANARSFAGSSTKGPLEVAAGETAAAVCIDFYGRYEAQRTRDAAIRAGLAGADAEGRIGYVDPPGETVIDPDPVALLTGAPDPELARRFVDFVLSTEGQAIWQFPVNEEGLGPREFELRRLPIRRGLYAGYLDRFVDQVDPWRIATPVKNPNRAMRSFIAPMFRGIALDQPELLQEAWLTITRHPAYPRDRGPLITASDVDDPELAEMIRRFDAMPIVPGPGGTEEDLNDPAILEKVKRGWLRRGWAKDGLWPAEADPSEMFRRLVRRQARDHYRAIIEGGQG